MSPANYPRALQPVPPSLSLPLLDRLVAGGIDYPAIVLVEFEAQSLWFEVALSLAAQAVRQGLPTDLHLFQRDPRQVAVALRRLGMDPSTLRDTDVLRIIDSYTVQTGLGVAVPPKGADAFKTQSIRLSDWAAAAKQQVTAGVPEAERRRFHIDDNLTVLARYNSEDEVIDYWRTRIIPLYRTRESILLNALSLGVASEGFYRQFEALCDGILELRAVEESGRIEQKLRVKAFHGKQFDSRWHRVRASDSGEAELELLEAGTPGRIGPAIERHLAAIMFTDIVGFTRLTQEDEARALRIRTEHQSLLRPAFRAHGGREVKSLGDGFLVEFSSAVESVRCAVEIQEAIARRNATGPESGPVLLRVGIHVGDVVREGEDLVGDGVNVASRIEPLAEPGGICLSGQVYDQVGNKAGLKFERLPPRQLKNVTTPIEVYKVLLAPDSPAQRPGSP